MHSERHTVTNARPRDRTATHDLTSVGAAGDLAAALRGMTGPRRASTCHAAGTLPVSSPRAGGTDGAWDAVGPASGQSEVTGSPWASATVAL